jgi:two-component system, NtrC family, response regulator GlrR
VLRSPAVRGCHLEVLSGPDRGRRETFDAPTLVIGRGAADFKVVDRAVSSMHAELRWTPQGYRIRDLGSTNGTYLKGVRVIEGFVHPGGVVVVGTTSIACHWSRGSEGEAAIARPAMNHKGIVGHSPQILQVLALIERLAPSHTTVLIHGETGTGKELVAEALHQGSMRAAGPFMVLDCSAVPAHLFEDQLFGHEAGSFTGADRKAVGVFEAAHGGTVFLDEVGEIPLEMQAKLLRVLESRQIRKIGSNRLILRRPPNAATSAPTCTIALRSPRSSSRRCASAKKISNH